MTGELERGCGAPWSRPWRALALGLFATSAACSVKVMSVNLGTKTALERQLVGELEPLSDEELLAASVRAEPALAEGPLADLQAAAVAARRRQLFNRDDVQEGERLGCLGEGRDAELVARACSGGGDPALAGRWAALAAEENEDRAAVVDWAIAADSALTPADRPEVVRVYRRLLVEGSRPGTWVQSDDGTWARR